MIAQLVKNPPAMQETWVQSLGWEDPLEKEKSRHSSVPAWRSPWAIVHGVTKSWTRMNDFHSHFAASLLYAMAYWVESPWLTLITALDRGTGMDGSSLTKLLCPCHSVLTIFVIIHFHIAFFCPLLHSPGEVKGPDMLINSFITSISSLFLLNVSFLIVVKVA